MPKSPIDLVKGDKVSNETDYRDNLPVNMTAIVRPMFGFAGYMIQAPGLTQYATGEGRDRGGLWNERQENHYRVSGTSLVSVSRDGVVTTIGTIAGTDTVSLPYSFNTQGIVADGRFYRYSPTIGLVEVTDPDLGNPIDCVWINGYYFFTDGDFIYHTDITDEASVDPLKFATAEFMPDDSLGLGKTQDNKVIVFGRYSTEFFVDQANDNFAFSRVETRAIKIGIVGTHAKAEMSDGWYILGGRKEEAVSVHRIGVGSAEKVATREVDKVIGAYTEDQLKTAILEARVEDGYSFLIVHLPNHVLQLNETMARSKGIAQAWSILKTGLGDEAWRAVHGVFEPRKGQWVYGDKNTANIGILDNEVATQYGDIAEWYLNTPFVYLDGQSINELEIETIPGFTAESDATVAISMSYNGVTYGKEWFKLYGLPNDLSERFIIRRLGYVSDWVGIRLRGATKSRMAFSRAVIDHG